MQEILIDISKIFDSIFMICFFVVFNQSIKKAFYKGQISGRKFNIQTFITNPVILFFASYFIAFTIETAVYVALGGDINVAKNQVSKTTMYSYVATLMGCIVFALMIIFFAYRLGKKLEAPNISLVIFLYLMFAVIFGLSGTDTAIETDEYAAVTFGVNLFKNMVLVIAIYLLYQLVQNTLSKLTDKKRFINAKMFLIPPLVFLLIYYFFNYLTYIYGGYAANIVLNILSLMILFLFIWAFDIIMKNIRATDDAVNAKDEIKMLSVEVMEALANTIDAKDKYTNGHSIRVADYSRMIAKKMGLSEEECENIYNMGLLHDIGKIGVPNEIINKPSRLTDLEFDVIKTHPEMGYSILSKIKSKPDLANGARWHHERYDGKGYPDNKSGEDIPLEARIIAVADSYDAMTSNRSYRKYLPQDTVRSEIEKNIGTQFDPEAAKCMLMIIDEDKEYKLRENIEL